MLYIISLSLINCRSSDNEIDTIFSTLGVEIIRYKQKNYRYINM